MTSVAIDALGNLYAAQGPVLDNNSGNRVLRIAPDGTTVTIAGNGTIDPATRRPARPRGPTSR